MISRNDDIQGTMVAPQGTAIAPQATAIAPQGTAAVPQGTAAVPENVPGTKVTYGKVVSSGSQADITVTKYDGRDCAMRLYKPGFGANKEVSAKLRKLFGKGYITDILEAGTKDGREYEIMPYYPLGSVAGYDLRGKYMEILTIAVKTAMSLDAMHRAHVIHKDIKPANILVTDISSWDTVICDFGIADIISGGKVVTKQSRTPIYAAPELYDPKNAVARIDGQDLFEITPAADFYSLGMTILCLWYGEKAFLRKEQELVVAKLKGAIKIPDDMPESLACLAEGLLQKDPRKRWGFKEVRDMLVPEALGEYGVKLFLNPLCDIRLNPDPESPGYIVTGEQIGKFLNEVYLWHFTDSPAPADEKLCDLVLDSFEEYENSYMETFFNSKGEYLKDFADWMQKCLDNDYDTKKIAPTDPHQRFQISMMKTIKGFGFTPVYTFSDTAESITDLEGLKGVRADKKSALEDGGLRGWIAVQLQEDPDADFSEHLSYESALMEYIETLGECDPECNEMQYFDYACEKEDETELKVRKVIRGVCTRRILQCVLTLAAFIASVPLVKSFIAYAKVDPAAGVGILDHLWIFAIIGLAAGVFVFLRRGSILAGFLTFGGVSFVSLVLAKLATDQMMWVMAAYCAAVGVFALILLILSLKPDKDAMSPSKVRLDDDDLAVECLDYTFSDAEDFDSSLNGFLTDGRLHRWKARLDKNRIRIIVCFCCLALAVAADIFLPETATNNTIQDGTTEEVQ